MAKLFIAGESTGSSSGQTYDVINPANGGDTEGKRFVSKFSSFLCRTLNYVL